MSDQRVDRAIRQSACTPAEVPPFCFLRPGVSVEKAVAQAARALDITDSASLVVLLWKLQAAAENRR